MYVRKIGIIILRPAPQHLPGDILITEKGIIIAFEILQSLSRIAVMERKVLDQEPGRPVFQRIGLVRAVMLQNRFQFRTVFARKFQSRTSRDSQPAHIHAKPNDKISLTAVRSKFFMIETLLHLFFPSSYYPPRMGGGPRNTSRILFIQSTIAMFFNTAIGEAVIITRLIKRGDIFCEVTF